MIMMDIIFDILEHILLIFMLAAMALAYWIRHTRFPTKGLSFPRKLKCSASPQSLLEILEQRNDRDEIPKDEDGEMSRKIEEKNNSRTKRGAKILEIARQGDKNECDQNKNGRRLFRREV